MNPHVFRYFQTGREHLNGSFCEVIPLQETETGSWETFFTRVPSLPKGWWELSKLNVVDRIEFTKEYWQKKIPFSPRVFDFFEFFFSKLDDIGIFLTKQNSNLSYQCEMVYSLKDADCFFRGAPPCLEQELEVIREDFEGILPEDYLSFLKIHDAFSKDEDSGLIAVKDLRKVYHELEADIKNSNRSILYEGKVVDPSDLIPFYQSFGKKSYQCFFSMWHPDQHIGNLCYSPCERFFPDISEENNWMDYLAFPTFSDWLIFYLENLEI